MKIRVPNRSNKSLHRTTLNLIPIRNSSRARNTQSPSPFANHNLLIQRVRKRHRRSDLDTLIPRMNPKPASIMSIHQPLAFNRLHRQPHTFRIINRNDPINMFPANTMLLPPNISHIIVNVPLILMRHMDHLPHLRLLPMTNGFLLMIQVPVIPKVFQPLSVRNY